MNCIIRQDNTYELISTLFSKSQLLKFEEVIYFQQTIQKQNETRDLDSVYVQI